MIGQKINLHLLDAFLTFPRFLVIEGPKGSGRTTLVKECCKHRGIFAIECAGDVETIRNIVITSRTSEVDTCYILDSNDLTKEAANALLKTCEEAGPLVHIALKTSDLSNVLETLLSRCLLIRMEPYSTEEIIDFIKAMRDIYGIQDEDFPYLMNTFTTPGDMRQLLLTPKRGKELIDFAHKTINHIDEVSDANAAKIVNMMAFNKEPDKYPVELFLTVIMRILSNETKFNPLTAARNRKLMINTSEALRKMMNNSLNKERIIYQWVLKCNNTESVSKGEA